MTKFPSHYNKDVLRVIIVAMAVAIYIDWPALIDPLRFHDNWRQSPHWMAPAIQSTYHPNDLYLRYCKFNTAPLENWLYGALAHTGIDIFWGKLIGIFYFSFTAMLIYLTGHAMRDRFCGWTAVIIYLFFPGNFLFFTGGFGSGGSAVFLCLAVYIIVREKWRWAIPTMGFAALLYPMAAIHIGVIFLLDIIANDLKKWHDTAVWKTKLLPLLAAALVGAAPILFKYLGGENEFGRLVTGDEIGNRVEFTIAGRMDLIPIRSIWAEIHDYWTENNFHIGLFFVAYFFAGKKIFKLPRGLYPLLFASIFLYQAAEFLVIQLYVPNRYLLRSLPIFMAFAGGYWLSLAVAGDNLKRIIISLPAFKVRIGYSFLCIIILIGIGYDEFKHRLRQGSETHEWKNEELYAAIRTLPGRPMLALHPTLAAVIPIMTGKSVLVSEELCHPWWTAYWEVVSTRMKDFFRAYYATNPETILDFIAKHQIDYMIIERHHFSSNYLNHNPRFAFQPFKRWVRDELRPSPHALLSQVPEHLCLYRDHYYLIIATADLSRWLGTLSNQFIPQ